MKFKGYLFNIGILLLIIFLYIENCKSYILNVNVNDKDDIFFFLFKNEFILVANYYNFKSSYFFSFNQGVIDIDLKIDYTDANIVKKKNPNQEVSYKVNKNSINLLNNLNIYEKYFSKIENSNNIYNDEGIDKSKSESQNKLYSQQLDNSIKNSNETPTKNSYKSNNLYLVLITSDQWLNYIKLKNKLEPSLKNSENFIFTSHFNCIKRYPLHKGIIKKTIKINQKNKYMLFLVNNSKLKINLKGNVIFYDNITKHLSHDFIFISETFLFASFLLLVLALVIVLYYIKYKEKLGIFMVLNILFFLLSTYFNYKNINFVRDNGYVHIYFWILANILKKVQEIISFIIYLQISLGDVFIRSHLSRIEIQFIICYSVISFYTGIFEVILGDFQAPRYILQAFAYLFIFVAINFTSTFLSARLSEENLSFHVAELYKKCDIYKKYRLVFFAVILKPIFLIIYKILCLSPSNIDLYSSHEYFYVFFYIIFDIILYIIIFVLFRPVKPIKLIKHILSNEDFHID